MLIIYVLECLLIKTQFYSKMKKYIKNNIGNITYKALFVIFIFIISMQAHSENETSVPYESFNVNINFDKIGYKNFQALYEDPAKLFLPVSDVFSFLKIPIKVNEDGSLIQGSLETEKNIFVINSSEHSILYLGKKTVVSSEEMILDMGTLFVKKDVLEKVFGFKIVFDFRSLSANFGSDKELPLAKLIKLEKARENLQKRNGEEKVDTALGRNYHWLKFGMMDWSYTTNQSQQYTNESRGTLGLGAEILGGEADLWLNYSDRYGFKKEQQRYYWRWVDNQNSIVKQVQIGRIYSTSIASLLYPMDGFVVSNTPTTVRKALGNYQIANYTQPNWLVEIYINNVLVNYTKADAAGYYSFNVPIVYGTSNIKLRFYGPNGEEKSEEKTFNMPYVMLPKGEFEYRATGARLIDSVDSKYGKAESNYGVTGWLTVGAGIEYLSSIKNHPEIPFVNFTLQPMAKLILTGEYAKNVRTKGTLNYTLSNAVLDLNYTKYKEGQDAIIYNYLEERVGSLSVPVRIDKVSGTTKATFRQNVYSSFKYSTAELMLSANYQNYNASLTNYSSWMSLGSYNIYSNLALSATFGKICTFRPSIQYDYSTRKMISYKAEVERKVFEQGYLSLGYENNILSDYRSFNVNFRYDFSAMSIYLSSYFNNKHVETSESATGSLAFGSGNDYVLLSRYNAVGKSGVSIEPYIDMNWNNKRDPGEPSVSKLNVKCNGGQIYYREKDSIVRIAGLEPFVDYIISMDESNFENVSWKITAKTIKVTTDPNQFKKISVAIRPMAEISGVILDDNGVGKGRILVNIYDGQGKLVASTQTESDGYFSYLGLPPGNYTVGVDSTQLKLLKRQAKTISVTIHPSINGEAINIGEMQLTNTQPLSSTLFKAKKEEISSDSMIQHVIFCTRQDSRIIPKYPLQALMKIMNEKPCLKLQMTINTDAENNPINQSLKKSAQNIKKNLINSGIDSNRISINDNIVLSQVDNKKTDEKKNKILKITFKSASSGCYVPLDTLLRASIDGKYYSVQLSALKSKKRAQKLVKRIKAISYPYQAFVVKESPFYKVIIGYFNNKEKALAKSESIRKTKTFNRLLK